MLCPFRCFSLSGLGSLCMWTLLWSQEPKLRLLSYCRRMVLAKLQGDVLLSFLEALLRDQTTWLSHTYRVPRFVPCRLSLGPASVHELPWVHVSCQCGFPHYDPPWMIQSLHIFFHKTLKAQNRACLWIFASVSISYWIENLWW